MNILVLGAYYSPNLGDGVICECAAYMLQRMYPDAQITICDLKNRTRYNHSYSGDIKKRLQKERQRDKLRRFVTKYLHWDKIRDHHYYALNKDRSYVEEICKLNADKVVIAGGQLFMGRYGIFLAEYIKAFAERNIPVYINGCGVGHNHNNSPAIRKLLADALTNDICKYVSCRDDTAYMDRLIHHKREILSTFDPAVWTDEVYEITHTAANKTVTGLGIMYAPHLPQQKLLRFWIGMVEALEKRNMPWAFFTNGSGTDEWYAREVFSRLPSVSGRFEDHFTAVPQKPRDLVQMLDSFKGIVSFRLHSHIISASIGVPSIAVAWDRKVPQFFEKIHHPERCFTIDDSPDVILKELETAFRTGYERELLEYQKDYCYEQLAAHIVHSRRRV